ncbi:DUF2066 domain-containing protein [Pelagibius sp. Alg239-R121]|uniref:DUF2066 domain-containing protein n=1 Tax=Pelagibius sp. Alg239-R121 TaxID=2993448 RepID=UPI0024A657D4|nr:DUF2066 domain-containing protein [Pelagibius sp. Alg239-R121]
MDATAAAAATARDAALAKGYLDAYARLIGRLVPKEEQARAPQLTSGQIANYTVDFSVARERTSSVRYLADITYRFRPEEVRRLLRNNGIGFAETRSKPVVVLPLQDAGGTEILWEDGNTWRDIWSIRTGSGGLVPLIVPLGDLSDISSISADEAVNGDAERLSALAERYGAGSVLVSRAALLGDAEVGTAELGLSMTRFDSNGSPQPFGAETYRQQTGELLEDFLMRAADTVEASIQERWKGSNVLRYGVESTIQVKVPVTGLGDWVEIQKRLREIPAVVGSNVQAISKQLVDLSITYVGDEKQLTIALRQNDLTLLMNEILVWELRLSGSEGPVSGSSVVPTSPTALPGGGAQQQGGSFVPGSNASANPEAAIQPEGVSDLGSTSGVSSPQPVE